MAQNNQSPTQEQLNAMKFILSTEEMDKYVETMNNKKLSDYWSWVKRTTKEEIEKYLDIQKESPTIMSQAAVILLNLAKKMQVS